MKNSDIVMQLTQSRKIELCLQISTILLVLIMFLFNPSIAWFSALWFALVAAYFSREVFLARKQALEIGEQFNDYLMKQLQAKLPFNLNSNHENSANN